MKERLRSSQSSNSHREDIIQRSQYESPKKMNEQHEGNNFGDEMQYKLEKVFQEAGNREQRYISIIKEQEEKMKKQSEDYLETLKEIKKQFLYFITKAKDNERHVWKALKSEQQFSSNKHNQRLNSIQFSTRILKDYAKQESKVQPELHCKIHFYYYTPFAEDCLRFEMPQFLALRIRNFYPGLVISKQIRVIKEQDEVDNINCLLNKVPFQISTLQNEPIVIQFKIPCIHDAISHYKRRELQVELVDKRGMFVMAYVKLSLKSILFHQERPTEWQLKPLSLFSPLDGSKIGEMSLKLGNSLVLCDRNEHYKVQSSTPMEINNFKSLVNYNDDESRMIQRISKFKSNTNSLLLGIGNTRDAQPQRFFENDNDRTILMHRQKKELQSILQYKNSHKSQLMDKLFNDAIDRYFLTQCEIGTPKFITFNYRNTEKEHKKLYAKIELTCKNSEGKPENVAALAIQQQIQALLVSPKQMRLLLNEQLIDIQEQTHMDYEFDEEESSLWSISGMSHAIIVKIICLPLKPSLTKQQALSSHYELKMNLIDQYNQVVQFFHTKLKIKPPALQSTLHVHGNCQSQSQLEIPFEEGEGIVKKTVLSNIPQLQYKWNSTFTSLNVRINHQYSGQRNYFLTINDSQNLYSISRYQLVLNSYPKLIQPILLQLGQVKKVALEFMLSEQLLTQRYKEIQNIPNSKAKTAKDQIRVLFASSKPEHCQVTCQSEPQIICKLSKVYQVDVKIQTFDVLSNPQKILIHALDLDRNIVLKRWLLFVEKQSTQNYKQVYKLSCQHGKPMRYKFQLMNEDPKQKSFQFYSSNLTIMTVPQGLVSLVTNQRITVQLEFNVRMALSPQQAMQPVKVILTVTDGITFNNYLFELNVRIR